MTEIRVGIVGCGAVTTKSHLPALEGVDGVRVTALADPQIERTREIALRFQVPKAVASYRELLDDVDALILALPHHLHLAIGTEVLKAGKHVLMEKPLANTVEECDALIAATEESKALFFVAQVRRYMIAYKAVKRWVESGVLGELTGFEAEEGGVYNWPVASDFFFRPEMSGGGVLMDTGAHVVDALLWWLGDLMVTSYEDDNAGGVEADCTMGLASPKGFSGSLILSRIRTLKNNLILHGEKADLEVALLANQARLAPKGTSFGLTGGYALDFTLAPQSTLDLFMEQAREWVKAIHGEPAEIAAAAEARRTIQVIRDAYSMQRRKVESWQRIVLETAPD